MLTLRLKIDTTTRREEIAMKVSCVRWVKKLAAGVLAIVFALPVLGYGVPTSEAASSTGNVYIVVNNSVCGAPDVRVRGILYHSLQTGDTSRVWDNGDNIVYPRVRFGVKNTITAQVRCDQRRYHFFWTPVGYRTVTATIYPTQGNQTFWIG